MKKNWILFLCIFFSMRLGAESFRVGKMLFARLRGEETVSMGLNSALAVRLPRDRSFLKGIELDITIPPEIVAFPGAAAYSFYANILPAPKEDQIDYTGDRQGFEVFPPRAGLLLGVPYGSRDALKASPYIKVMPFVCSETTELLFFRIQLVMKGAPDAILSSAFSVTVKPVFEDKGRLDLSFVYPQDKDNTAVERPFTVFINEIAVEVPKGGIILDAGVHHLSVVSDYYRNETRVITILKGQTIPLVVSLKDIAPTLLIAAPEGADVFFDNEKIEGFLARRPFTIAPGDHTVRFLLGGYETLKTVHAVNGKSYTVTLDLNVEVIEEP